MSVYRTRTEQHQIKQSHSYYKLIDHLCSCSKNIYNRALYEQRQCYFKFNRFMSYPVLYDVLKTEEVFKQLPSVLGQQVLRQVTTNCNSFIKASIAFSKDNSKFRGRPKLPKYKSKDGRFKLEFTSNTFRLKNNTIHFHKCLEGFTIHTKQQNIRSIQIVPRNNIYIVDIIYDKEFSTELQNPSNLKYIAGIDQGIDNFSAITVWNNTSKPLIINGKGLKSYNKQFNKILASLQSEAKKRNNKYITKRIQRLIQKRNNYIQTWMHKASRITVDYLQQNQVGILVIGHNKGWKDNSQLSKQVNQTFIQIPYNQYISYITYKAQEVGIKVYIVEESYTSGTSFIDNEEPTKENYNRSRRIYRGLFKSNDGTKINSDVNASYQISKKAFKGLVLNRSQFTVQQFHNKLEPYKVNVA